jgi:hypothetical protein
MQSSSWVPAGRVMGSGRLLVSPGMNLHTWTGWGSITYWNTFVANLETHGKRTFFDPRLNEPVQCPIAARADFEGETVAASPGRKLWGWNARFTARTARSAHSRCAGDPGKGRGAGASRRGDLPRKLRAPPTRHGSIRGSSAS